MLWILSEIAALSFEEVAKKYNIWDWHDLVREAEENDLERKLAYETSDRHRFKEKVH
tara:strand:+ start:345 stop:515 length:171 start_codon:yes stop_codon:yes gene_type:complete